MSAIVLAIEAYEKIAKKVLSEYGRDLEVEGPTILRAAANECRQAHRLLAEGRRLDELTPLERMYAKALRDLKTVKVPNDYGWEPGVEIVEKTETPPQKPKKNGK